ncbi:MAG: hypothetical protein ACFFCQ_02835 [Promethearchaeota archaeon]
MKTRFGLATFFLIIGIFFILGAIPLLIISEEYLYGPMISVSSDDSYVIVLTRDVELISDVEAPWELNELMNVKIRVYPGSQKDLLVGIVPTGIAREFYENANRIMVYSPFQDDFYSVSNPGQLTDPSIVNTLGSTTDLTEFNWTPKEGRYTLLIFNQDLSRGIYASFQVGARYYFFEGIGVFLITIGSLFCFLCLIFIGHSLFAIIKARITTPKAQIMTPKARIETQKAQIKAPKTQPTIFLPIKSQSTYPDSSLKPSVKESPLQRFSKPETWTGNQVILLGLVIIAFTIFLFLESSRLFIIGIGLPFGIYFIIRGDQRNWDLLKRQERILGSISTVKKKEKREEWQIYLDEIRSSFYGDSEYYSSLDPGFDRIKRYLVGGGLAFFGLIYELEIGVPGFMFIIIGLTVVGHTLFRERELKNECELIERAIETTKNPTLAEIAHILGKPEQHVRKRIEHMRTIGELNIRFNSKTGSLYHIDGEIPNNSNKVVNSVNDKREYCEYCGRVLPGLPEDNKFCPSCGIKLH